MRSRSYGPAQRVRRRLGSTSPLPTIDHNAPSSTLSSPSSALPSPPWQPLRLALRRQPAPPRPFSQRPQLPGRCDPRPPELSEPGTRTEGVCHGGMGVSILEFVAVDFPRDGGISQAGGVSDSGLPLGSCLVGRPRNARSSLSVPQAPPNQQMWTDLQSPQNMRPHNIPLSVGSPTPPPFCPTPGISALPPPFSLPHTVRKHVGVLQEAPRIQPLATSPWSPPRPGPHLSPGLYPPSCLPAPPPVTHRGFSPHSKSKPKSA